MSLKLIWAESENGFIGKGHGLPWRIASEMKHFKLTTQGHFVVVGYNTLKGFNGRLLPNRTTLLYTEKGYMDFNDLEVMDTSIDDLKHFQVVDEAEVVELAKTEDVYVIGGKATYENFMPLADEIIRTIIHEDVDGDVEAPYVVWDWFLKTQTRKVSKDGEPSYTIEHYRMMDQIPVQ